MQVKLTKIVYNGTLFKVQFIQDSSLFLGSVYTSITTFNNIVFSNIRIFLIAPFVDLWNDLTVVHTHKATPTKSWQKWLDNNGGLWWDTVFQYSKPWNRWNIYWLNWYQCIGDKIDMEMNIDFYCTHILVFISF